MTQDEALSILKTGANVFLTGEPGSGKTHTINRYVAYLRSCGIEPSITASTGIAATHIGGMTIHSWSGIGVKSRITREDIEFLGQRERLVRRIINARVLIIDEISMLAADTLDSVELVMRSLRNSEAPFGGVQIVLVGDFFQLPPVEPRRAQGAIEEIPLGASATQFAFRSRAWEKTNPIVCFISEQHRQEDAAFLEALAALRRGDITEEVRACFSARSLPIPSNGVFTKLFPHNADVDRINEAELSKLSVSGHTFRMTGRGAPLLIESLKKSCLSPERLSLKVGAKVMFTKNDVEGKFVNGTTGEVIGFSKMNGYPVVKAKGARTIEAEPMDWSIQDGTKILAKISQVPLRLAWAITVHKSQGMSLDAAVIDLSTAFEYGQGYVALSRVRTLSGLYLLGYNDRALEVHPDVSVEDVRFRARSEKSREAIREIDAEKLLDMHVNFIRACGGSVGSGRAGRGSGRSGTSARGQKKQSSTYDATKELVFRKLSLQAMAEERGVTVGTIISHLEKLAAEKKIDPSHDLAHFERNPDRFEEMRAAFKAVRTKGGTIPLSPARELLDESFSYSELRLARLFLHQDA